MEQGEIRDQGHQQVGEYRLIRLLGAGTFGNVYLGEHLLEKRPVAIKILRNQLTSETLKDFLSEARTFRLKHPHIIQLLDFGIEDHTPYLVMEYAPHGTLSQRHPQGTPVPLPLVYSYVAQLADALAYAHDHRLIHRDVKPQNMLLGVDEQVLLSDFGIAVMAPASQSFIPIAEQRMAGTIPYMAPEQLQGKPRPASDQYALGVIVYEWLCGIRPFQGSEWEIIKQHLEAPPPPLREKTPALPPAVEAVVLKALEKNPHDRFPHMRAFAEAFQHASHHSTDESVLARREEHPLLASGKQPIHAEPDLAPSDQESPVSPVGPTSKLPSFQKKVDQQMDRSFDPLEQNESARANQEPISSPVIPQAMEPTLPFPERRVFSPNRSRRKIIMFVGLVVLLVASSAFLSPFIVKSLVNHPATPTRLAQSGATATASAEASAKAYADGTAINGAMMGFDPAHTNNNPYEKVLASSNVSHLTPLWWTSVVIDSSSPIVVGGRIYVKSSDALYAFDASCLVDCQPLWVYRPGGNVRFALTVPAVAHGMLYVTFGEKLYAFDARCRSGCEPLWVYSTGNTGYSINGSPTIADGKVYLGNNETFYAFDTTCLRDCQPLWTYPTNSLIVTSAAVANGLVYVDDVGGTMYVFDAGCLAACRPLWTYSSGMRALITPVVAGGMVYIGAFDVNNEGKLLVFDATCQSDCQPLWTYSLSDPISAGYAYFYAPPAVANGLVYLGSADDRLYTFDATCRKTCQPLWTYQVDNHIFDSPTVANGVVYVGSDNNTMGTYGGRLYAFDAACRSNCHPLWVSPGSLPITESPVVANGVVYVPSGDIFYALGISATEKS